MFALFIWNNEGIYFFMPYFGAHLSTAGGVQNAVIDAKRFGFTAVQLFTKSQLKWKDKPIEADHIDQFKEELRDSEITYTIAHSTYLINLASPEENKNKRSVEGLKEDIRRTKLLGIPYLVMHPGSHMGSGLKNGIKRINQGLRNVLEKGDNDFCLVLETTSGAGNQIGGNIEELSMILDKLANQYNLGICIDTAHVYGAGYDLAHKKGFSQMMDEIKRYIGFDKVKVIHSNDSSAELGSKKDRHEHIGKGGIGKSGFCRIVNAEPFKKLPFILETPATKKNGYKEHIMNANTLRDLVK